MKRSRGLSRMSSDEERLAEVERKLVARESQPGYRENALKAEIARPEGKPMEKPE